MKAVGSTITKPERCSLRFRPEVACMVPVIPRYLRDGGGADPGDAHAAALEFVDLVVERREVGGAGVREIKAVTESFVGGVRVDRNGPHRVAVFGGVIILQCAIEIQSQSDR